MSSGPNAPNVPKDTIHFHPLVAPSASTEVSRTPSCFQLLTINVLPVTTNASKAAMAPQLQIALHVARTCGSVYVLLHVVILNTLTPTMYANLVTPTALAHARGHSIRNVPPVNRSHLTTSRKLVFSFNVSLSVPLVIILTSHRCNASRVILYAALKVVLVLLRIIVSTVPTLPTMELANLRVLSLHTPSTADVKLAILSALTAAMVQQATTVLRVKAYRMVAHVLNRVLLRHIWMHQAYVGHVILNVVVSAQVLVPVNASALVLMAPAHWYVTITSTIFKALGSLVLRLVLCRRIPLVLPVTIATTSVLMDVLEVPLRSVHHAPM